MSVKGNGGFSVGIIIGVVLVGVFAFSAFLVLSAFEPELSSGHDGRAHALSTSAVGFAGAVRLARETGATVNIGRTIGAQNRRASLVIVTPENAMNWAEFANTTGRTTLVILPKWLVGPDPTHRGWVSRVGAAPPQAIGQILTEIAPGTEIVRDAGISAPELSAPDGKIDPGGAIEEFQTISGASLSPIVIDAQGRSVVARVLRGGRSTNVYVLSDPDFLNTQGLANLQNARAGLSLLNYLRPDHEPIVFDVTANGLGSARSALRLAFEPPFLGATLALVFAVVLLGWRAALRFGPSVQAARVIALGKSVLANNSAALIRLTGRENRLGPGYARLTASVVTEAAGFGRKEEAEAAPLLDSLSSAQGASATFSQLSSEAAAAKTPQQMLEAARKLHAWKKEIIRATG